MQKKIKNLESSNIHFIVINLFLIDDSFLQVLAASFLSRSL